MPRQERTKSGTGIYHVMLRGINRQDIFEDDGDYLQTELHSQVNERLWCGNTPALSIDQCLLWSYTEVMKKEKMITEPSPGHNTSVMDMTNPQQKWKLIKVIKVGTVIRILPNI